MARRILMRHESETVELLERGADSEKELQDVLRRAPNLIPLDDLGLDGPMMVVGRETALPSGRIDLLGVTPGGDVLVIEFKTGPQNPDYRHALAQLLDYGADLWRMDFAAFESTVTVYLNSKECPAGDAALGADSLREAARRTWPLLEEAELDAFERRVASRLADGGFQFVLAAQRITRNSRSTIEYLQQMHRTGRFHAVEVVKFTDAADQTVAFEGRAITTSMKGPSPLGAGNKVNAGPEQVLAAIDDPAYRDALEELIAYCRSMMLSFEAGAVGFSIRVAVPDRKEPVTLGYLFPPGKLGYLGLTGLNLGADQNTVGKLSVASQFAGYAERLRAIEGTEEVQGGGFIGVHVSPATLAACPTEIAAAVGDLVASIGEVG